MNIEIKHRFSGRVLWSGEADSLGSAVKKAIKDRADLTGAVLTGADLRRADLTGADLTDADLRRADLTDADLTNADLTGADLTDADLRRAVLTGAVLTGADLRRAVLTGADLTDADLTDADLTDADLTGADLTDAVLRRAVLTDADLRRAVLTGADLTGAVLTDAVLTDAAPSIVSAPPEDAAAKAQRVAARRARYAERYRLRRPDVPVIPHLDAKILDIVEGREMHDGAPGGLDMRQWHCGTSHCRAGWSTTLAGAKGAELEAKYGPAVAGGMIYRASAGHLPYFFATNEEAIADMREGAELDRLVPAAGAP